MQSAIVELKMTPKWRKLTGGNEEGYASLDLNQGTTVCKDTVLDKLKIFNRINNLNQLYI